MADFSRREFIKRVLLASSAAFMTDISMFKELFAKEESIKNTVKIELPHLPFQETILTGKKKGGRILIIGGIHGNEPGAYKAADILRQITVKRGELIIAPRTNFLSILANQRGYNGDMNRKFAHISHKDPDYPYVQKLKELIRSSQADLVLTLHDGYGFHATNPKAWGQCIVIDEESYMNLPLGKIARIVAQNVNKRITKRKWKIPVFNTHTFSPNTKHPEQRKSLTYFSLTQCKTPAICLEASKQLPSLKEKVKIHLLMLKEFFKIYSVEIEPDFEYLIENLPEFLSPQKFYSAKIAINNQAVVVSKNKTFYVKRGSHVKFLSFSGTDGTNALSFDVNLNWRSINIKRRIAYKVKDDFRELFTIRFVVC